MLKQIGHIILSVLLLISTIGVAISKHYCSGNFVSVSVFQEAEPCCGDSDCCHNETQVFQVKDDFAASQVSEIPQLAELEILGQQLSEDFIIQIPESEVLPCLLWDSPPPLSLQTSLSLKQVYLL